MARRVREAVVGEDATLLREGFAAIRRELEIPEAFPADALDEAERAVREGPAPADREDLRGVGFVTLDPPGSRDLDQAFHLEPRDGGALRLRYAIADVAAWVAPGGALDAATRERGTTLYAPDGRTPLHPHALGEGAASLLPGQDTPAVVWTVDVDEQGEVVADAVRRATVRSRAQLGYPDAQRALDAGAADGPLALLPDAGERLRRAEQARGGFDLPLPDQEVVATTDGSWTLELRAPLACERDNAQLSLLTGRVAARRMLERGVGLLRTLPPPERRALDRLRAAARALDVDWPDGRDLAAVLRTLDATHPRAAAFLEETTELLRGAAYVAFDGQTPEQPQHGAIAAPYAHVTAPLRRLGDRFATACCLDDDPEPPAWAREALSSMPEILRATAQRAGKLERACVDLVEAVLLRDRVGEAFTAAVVDDDTVTIPDPPVRARCDGDGLEPGATHPVRLVEADPGTRRVRFAPDR